MKHYYAGSQRIAMRKNGTLNFILGDHLGSTSLVTDDEGTVINETQYKAWGETRYSSGTEQTKYGYTGQYSYVSDFGLHFYNARWYDSSLSRFAQADTIVPDGIQGYDRYAYVNNNPVRYTDPTGHDAHWCTNVTCQANYNNSMANKGGGGATTTSTPALTVIPTPANTSTEILVCGYGAGNTCDNTTQYGGQQPLSPYDNILPNQNAMWVGVDGCNDNGQDPKYCAAMKIYNQIANAPGSYHLVGHSAGGSSVIWAVRMLQDAGFGNRIASITLLDPARDGSHTFSTGNGSVTVNIFDMANEIVANGNNIFVGDFIGEGSDRDITGLNSSNYTEFIPPEGSAIDGHYLLATSNKIFDAAAGYWEWQK